MRSASFFLVLVVSCGSSQSAAASSSTTGPRSDTSIAPLSATNLVAKIIKLDANLMPETAVAIMVEPAAPFAGRIADEQAALQQVRRSRRSCH